MTLEKTFKLESQDGLHARPAGLFVKCLAPFQVSVEVELRGQKKNGKSIMSLMSLGAAPGDDLKITITGNEADSALKSIEELFAKKFSAE